MKKTIICVFITTLLVATTFSFAGMAEENKNVDLNQINESKYSKILSILPTQYNNFVNGDILDQQQTTDCRWGWNIHGDQWCAQGFTPSLKILTRVQLGLFKGGNPPEDAEVIFSIRENLTGDDLISITLKSDELPPDNNGYWIEFNFEDINVTPNSLYYIVCKGTAGNNLNCYCWLYDNNNPYDNGEAWLTTNHGKSWVKAENTEHPDTDFCFKTYGIPENPAKPETPTGPEEGNIGEELLFSTSTTDPKNLQISYIWDWGDGNFSDWLGPYDSGQITSKSYAWTSNGLYIVKVKAKNTDGFESEWSNPILVGVPKKDESIDQEQTKRDKSYGGWANSMFAQSFIPTKNTLTKVSLEMFRVGNPSKITISIRDDLNGVDLVTIEKTGNSIPESHGWIDFDFQDIEISSGKTYYIVWDPEAIDNNTFYWGFGIDNPYLYGNGWEYPPWKEFNPPGDPNPDFCFKTYYANVKSKNSEINPFLKFLEQNQHIFPLLRQILNLCNFIR